MYGLLISIGGILAFLISEKAAKKRGLNLKVFYIAINFAVIGGVVGARLWHVIDYWAFYSENIGQAFEIWKGGLGIFGGLIGGGLATVCVLAFYKERILAWLDIFVLGLPLAQAIGRWGNFFNQEVYGVETSLPWGLIIDGRRHHPLFLYESMLNLTLFLVLQYLWTHKKLKEGYFFGIYIGAYVAIRILLQPLRLS